MWNKLVTISALTLLIIGISAPGKTALAAAPTKHIIPAKDLKKILISEGLRRTYSIHIPPTSAGRQSPRPLLIVLHGSYGTGEKMQRALGFDRYSNKKGFLVTYPNAYRRYRWNDGRDTLSEGNRSVNDVQFLVDLVNAIKRDHAIDTTRVFITGASNGGMMIYRLGCQTSSVFAGFAPIIANMPLAISESCSISAPSRFLAINGEADPIVPYQGGDVCKGISRRLCEHGDVLSFDESIQKFAGANQCESSVVIERAPRVNDGTLVQELRFADCSQSARTVGLTVRGGGHTWPPFPGQLPISGVRSKNLNATGEIVRFFFGQ